VTATSSNTALIPDASIGIGGSGADRTVTATPAAGQTGTATVTLTVTDGNGATSTETFTVTVNAPPPADPAILVGGPAAGIAQLLVSTNGTLLPGATLAFFPGSTTAASTAVADVTGDGVPDFIGGAGPGGGPRVVVIDGATGQRVADFFAFEPTFAGGVYVAAADFDGDGKADVVVGAGDGGGPVVAVYSGAAVQLARFLGIADENFRGGVRVAAGDVNGDGTADIAAAAGPGGGPRVALFDGRGLASDPRRLTNDFFAFQHTFRGGVYVAAGDGDGDGFADLALGAGDGGGPRVVLVSGKSVTTASPMPPLEYTPTGDPAVDFQALRGWSLSLPPDLFLASLFAGEAAARGGVRVAFRDSDGDGQADLVTGTGAGEPSRVRVYRATTLLGTPNPAADQELDPFGIAPAEGVFVG
jgi:hypothetical protein